MRRTDETRERYLYVDCSECPRQGILTMEDIFSEVEETIFRDKGVLEEEYQPDTIVEREEELTAYRNALKDLLFGRNPPNIFVYGKTGVGKTAVTRYVLQALQTEVDQRDEADDLTVLFQNCNGDSVYGVMRESINAIREPHEDPFPKKGLSTADAISQFYEELEEVGGTFLCVFDEIDHLSNLDTLLYELPRARANGYLKDAHVGIIGISNNYKFRNNLSPKVRDTLMEAEISFSPYQAGELRKILNQRVDLAFVDGACDQSAVSKASALAARDTGNARQALDLLSTGGDIAEEQNDMKVTDKHIDKARDRVKRGHALNKIQDQTIHAQLVLETVARLEVEGNTPARSKAIKSQYDTLADTWGHEPLTALRSVQNHLSDLTMLGFLNRYERNEGRDGGYYHEYNLDLDATAVIEARESIE